MSGAEQSRTVSAAGREHCYGARACDRGCEPEETSLRRHDACAAGISVEPGGEEGCCKTRTASFRLLDGDEGPKGFPRYTFVASTSDDVTQSVQPSPDGTFLAIPWDLIPQEAVLMSRSFPILVATILVAGAMGAEAQPTRPATPSVFSERALVSAFASSSAAQGEDVAAKVKAALKADPDLGGPSEAVTVTAAGGIVTLEGTVPTVQIRARIAELAMKVEGVTKLVNKLKLAKK